MKFLRPYSLTVGTILLFEIWVWIDMSGADYRPGAIAGGRITAGWFIFGAPFHFGFALLLSLFVTLIARRIRPIVGWLLVLGVFLPAIIVSVGHTTPNARLREALNVDSPAKTTINHLMEYDSFGDGRSIAGVCSASPQFAQKVIDANALKKSDRPNSLLQQFMRDEPIPEDADVLENDELTIYFDADRSLLYFLHEPPARKE